MTKEGKDREFGVPADQMISIEKAPFYSIHRHLKLTLTCSGVNIDEHHRCSDENDKPIEELYAVGNVVGNMYGAIDYPLRFVGINLDNNYISAYTTVNYVADLKEKDQ